MALWPSDRRVDKSVCVVELRVCVSLSNDYGHTPLPMVIKFGINVQYFGTNVEWPMSEYLYPSRFNMAAVVCVFHAFTVKRLDRCSLNLDSVDIFITLCNCLELYLICQK